MKFHLRWWVYYVDNDIMILTAKEAKKRFQEIGERYPREILLSYIVLFRENWINRKNRDYAIRLNYLRYLVYSRIMRSFK